MAETHGLERLGPRRGTRPATTPTNPHQQLDQNAPTDLQEELFGRGLELAGVYPGPSGISVPGARAFHLEPRLAKGPLQAFMVGTEFALKGGKRASNSSRPRIDVVETAQDWTGGDGSGA